MILPSIILDWMLVSEAYVWQGLVHWTRIAWRKPLKDSTLSKFMSLFSSTLRGVATASSAMGRILTPCETIERRMHA